MFIVLILFPLFLFSLLVSVIAILFAGKAKRAAVTSTILLLYAVAFGLALMGILVLAVLHTITSPMTVDRHDVIGTYRVDEDMFAGPQADWQHDHFRLTITEKDTVVLESQDGSGTWHTFKRPIVPGHGTWSYLWRFPTEGDSTAHHLLANTPTLHREPWGFYYSFPSPRFGNVFFRKE